MRRVGCLLVLVLLTACQFKGQPQQPSTPASSPTEDTSLGQGWVSQPTAMRVYPTTRFVKQGDQTVLEARVELFDEMGDSVKGAGEMRLELRDARSGGAEALLYTWQVSLMTLEDQQRYYDPVTRSYLFHLKLDDNSAVKRNPVLSIFYTMPSGQRFTAEAPIKTDW